MRPILSVCHREIDGMWDVRGECEERVILWCGGYVMHCSSCGH